MKNEHGSAPSVVGLLLVGMLVGGCGDGTAPEADTAPAVLAEVSQEATTPYWDTPKRDHCRSLGLRQWSAVLLNVPWGQSASSWCQRTPVTIENRWTGYPRACIQVLWNMWGEFDVPDSSCAPWWDTPKRDHCVSASHRQYSAIIRDVPPGMTADAACWQTRLNVQGYVVSARRCSADVLGQWWGEFDVPDSACAPWWDTPKQDHCVSTTHRQHSAILRNIPPGGDGLAYCWSKPLTVAGRTASARRCSADVLGQVWGEFDFSDSSCAPWWDVPQVKGCQDSGRQLYASIIRNIPPGMSAEAACNSTGGTFGGQRFARPQRCKADLLGQWWGEFEAVDPQCNPVTECTDPAPPSDAFAKVGNDGSVSCDAFCANRDANWGARGTCVKGRVNSGLHAGQCVPCRDVPAQQGDTNVTCYCRAPAVGFADLHNHQFANLGFGGRVFHGEAFGPIQEALPWCTAAHGPGGVGDLTSYFQKLFTGPRLERLLPGHHVGGYPEFDGWPRWDNVMHQAVYEDWLYRAVQGGLRLMVMLAVNNESIAGVVQRAPGVDGSDMQSVDMQLDAAWRMQADIDARAGGPGKGWYRIVTTPAEARQVIAEGKLAVVLGIEVDDLFGCSRTGGCDAARVEQFLDAYHARGVRHVFPVHLKHNVFAGPALYSPIQWLLEVPPQRDCSAEGYTYLHNIVWPPVCSPVGLTDLGRVLVQGMMRRGMIIDIDHMSARAFDDTLDLVEPYGYPVVGGHEGFIGISKGSSRHEGNRSAEQLQRIRDVGGMVGVILHQGGLDTVDTWRGEGQPVVEHRCGGTSQTWAQAYLYAVKQMGGRNVALGTDYNGLAGLPAPRFGADACFDGKELEQTSRVSYPLSISTKTGPSRLYPSMVGNQVFDVNEDGPAHVGMLPDFIEDLRRQGIRNQDLDPLMNSAEHYVQMWERAYAAPKP
ncbi:membrane dipeptidase [Myxococcus sp. Y35]|uniref:membrane dipeptidase n=1 Tax=Pseudomyxococcus flavus TaxID=3115648 RepID=UPI003CF9F71F